MAITLEEVLEIFGKGCILHLPGAIPPITNPDPIRLPPSAYEITPPAYTVDPEGGESATLGGSEPLSRSSKNKSPSSSERCPNPVMAMRYIFHGHDGVDKEKLYFVPCKRWSCPVCSKKNYTRMAFKIRVGLDSCLESHKNSHIPLEYLCKFIGLTAPGVEWRSSHSLEDRETLMRDSLEKWFKICRKKLGWFEYFWVAEPQTDGTIHFHVIVVGLNISSVEAGSFMKEVWEETLGMGWAKVKKTYGGARGLSKYLASYLTESVYRGSKKRRVYGSSKGFRDAWKKSKDDWIANREPITLLSVLRCRKNDDGKWVFTPFKKQRGAVEIDFLSEKQKARAVEVLQANLHYENLRFPRLVKGSQAPLFRSEVKSGGVSWVKRE